MKAVVCESYGTPEVLKFKDVPNPIPKDNEILIKVRASSVNAADCNVRGLVYIPKGLHLLAKMMLGFNKPKKNIQGSIIAGEVEAIGISIHSFKVGDKVFGTLPDLGAYAEYVCRTEEGAIVKMPINISYEQAAAIPYGALTALYFLRDKANVMRGQKVLIKGASGGVGVYAVQIASLLGAEVTGVCSTVNNEFVKSLGATNLIDYKKEDVCKSSEKWDIIFDNVVGNASFIKHKGLLKPEGIYLAVAGGINDLLQMVITKFIGKKKVVFGGGESCEKKENLEYIKELVENGKLIPILDKIFDFKNIVDAHKYVESGQKKGNIAIKI